MRVIPKDKVIYSFNRHTPAAWAVADGETFWVETEDGYRGQIDSPEVLPADRPLACDLQICQVVNKLVTVRVRAPKADLQIAALLD